MRARDWIRTWWRHPFFFARLAGALFIHHYRERKIERRSSDLQGKQE